MEDLTQNIAKFENAFNAFCHYIKKSKEFRQEISHVWNDNASKDINSKFIDLLFENSESIICNLKSQSQKVGSSLSVTSEIESNSSRHKALSNEIDVNLNYCESNIHDIGRSLQSLSLEETKVDSLIGRANESLSELEQIKNDYFSIVNRNIG